VGKRARPEPMRTTKSVFRIVSLLLGLRHFVEFGAGKGFLFQRALCYLKKHITLSAMLAAARRSHATTRISKDAGLRHQSPRFNSALLAPSTLSEKGETIVSIYFK
jgi:hypothetical protein